MCGNVIPKVSVVILAYKVELYIDRCLYSLLGQTIDDIESVFTGDCSPNVSVSVML